MAERGCAPLDEHHGDALGVDVIADREDRLSYGRGQPERGFVDEPQPGARHEPPADGEHPLFTARERAGQLAPTIVDRRDELIINSGGKNMSPVNIESKIKSASLRIGQAVAIGDRRPYNVALIVLDADVAAAYAARQGFPSADPGDLCEDSGVQAIVEAAVARANRQLSRIEQIKRRILPVDWQPAGDELTPSMKLKRKPMAESTPA